VPERVAGDAARLSRFHNEVRVARQVTHPNVCRVHDIGEAGGRHFLSMEYVDGEDLASLLRRIGRLPQAKGLEIARQVALGLAAAHERHVLHRDLKPANVMIDGRGIARLTDFGLAVIDDEAPARELAGTPAYMAPEQLAGAAPSVPSEIYALGLLLYELFCGRPAFRAASLEELLRAQREPPPPPSAVASEIEPALERVILRCLERDPERRFASARAVAIALPGGDPLGSLVAAGETPPPELVAAVGDVGAMRPALAWACLAFVVAAFPLSIGLMQDLILLRQAPLPSTPEVLADRAARLARALTLAGPPAATAHGLGYTPAGERLTTAQPPAAAPGQSPIDFWYREAPFRLAGWNAGGHVRPDDPPPTVAGMVTIHLDTAGRLVSLLAVPANGETAPRPADASGEPWAVAFREAGLDATRFREVPPAAVLPIGAGQRRAWQGSAAEDSAAPLRVEAVVADERLLFFRVYGPADPLVPKPPPTPSGWLQAGAAFAYLAALLMAAVLARRNVRLGRSDRAGAKRVAAGTFAVGLAVWALEARYAWAVPLWRSLLADGLRYALYNAALVWLLYVAVEPTVRRRWPGSLVSWTRLLAGRVRDPMVGRDALVGMAFAAGAQLLWVAGQSLGARLSPQPLETVRLDMLLGWRPFAAWMVQNLIVTVTASLFAVVVVVGLRAFLRQERLAEAGAVVVLALVIAAGTRLSPPSIVFAVLGSAVVVALIRSGLLAVMVGSFFLSAGRPEVPVTTELGAWYGLPTLGWLIVAFSVASFGLYVALGGRPLAGALADE
jgi:serine/threonine-protein kinase